MTWTPEELAEMAAADAEIESNFELTEDEIRASDALDDYALTAYGTHDRDRRYAHSYYMKNRERIREKNKAYYEANRERIRLRNQQKYKERKRREQLAKGLHIGKGPAGGPGSPQK